MARSKRGLWFKFGRFLSGIVLVCFFMPFFGVSCGGMDVITVSGTDMVGGCKPGGLIADAEEEGRSRRGGMDGPGDMMSGDVKLDRVEREPLAIAALALALIVFGLSWVRTKGALVGAFVVSLMCLGTLVGLYIKVGGDLNDAVEKATKKGGAETSEIMKEGEVDAGSRFGLWLVCLGLIGAAAVTGLALREPEGAELAPPPA
jgi:hypothetical protein